MQDDHWIMWIDTYINDKFAARTQLLPPSLQAAACVHIKTDQKGTVKVIEHCNKHGSWMASVKLP
jgi:desulfoferrodoxin (superoxide reductase-like protein)